MLSFPSTKCGNINHEISWILNGKNNVICHDLLALDEIELIFFRVANAGLWFGFVVGRVLITQNIMLTAETQENPVSGPFLLLTPSHQGGWGYTRNWRGHSWDNWPQLTPGNSIPHGVTLSKQSWGKEEYNNVWSDGVCLPQSLSWALQPCFLTAGWTPA